MVRAAGPERGRRGGVRTPLVVADTVKDDSVQAIGALHDLGPDTVILTGDNARTAAAIAARVGVRRVPAEVLPEHKPTRSGASRARAGAS